LHFFAVQQTNENPIKSFANNMWLLLRWLAGSNSSNKGEFNGFFLFSLSVIAAASHPQNPQPHNHPVSMQIERAMKLCNKKSRLFNRILSFSMLMEHEACLQ